MFAACDSSIYIARKKLILACMLLYSDLLSYDQLPVIKKNTCMARKMLVFLQVGLAEARRGASGRRFQERPVPSAYLGQGAVFSLLRLAMTECAMILFCFVLQ